MNALSTKSSRCAHLILLALIAQAVTGCSTLQGLLEEDQSAASTTSVFDPLIKTPPPLTPGQEAAQKDGWQLLSAQRLKALGTCKALQTTSPIAEYWEVEDCNAAPTGQLSWLRGRPKGLYHDVTMKCPSDLISCDVVYNALSGAKPVDEALKLFKGLVIVHSQDIIKAMMGDVEYSVYYGGGFFDSRHFGFYMGIVGVGALGQPQDRPYLDGLVDQPWKVENLGRELRLKVAMSYWWLADHQAAPMLMTMLSPEHAKAHQNREFRPVILGALAAWGSDAAVGFCKDTLRDLGSEDRAACMWYLVERGQADPVDMVRYVEESGPVALFALAKTKSKEALKYLKSKSIDDGIEYVVATALAGDNEAMAALEKLIEKDPSYRNRRTVVALGYLAGTPFASRAIALAKKIEAAFKADESEALVATACGIRAQLGDKAAISSLIEQLKAPDEYVRLAVAEHVGGDFGRVLGLVPGFRVVGDQALYEAFVQAIPRESDDGNRENMTRAALNIRAKLRLAK